MYIDNGPNQGFPNSVIVTSKDGITWEPIQKSRIDNITNRFAIGWSNPPSNPYQYPNMSRIGIHMGGMVMDFDIQEIVNQPAWQGGTQVQHTQAVSDITNWL
jgi:hypothetical protein